MRKKDTWRFLFNGPIEVGDILKNNKSSLHQKYVLIEIDPTFSHPYLLRSLETYKIKKGAWYHKDMINKMEIVGHITLSHKRGEKLDG